MNISRVIKIAFISNTIHERLSVRFYCSGGVLRFVLLVEALLLSTASHIQAQVIDWSNTIGVPDPWFHEGGNWDGGVAPDSTETANFAQEGAYEVLWDSTTVANTPEVQFLNLEAGDVTFLNNGGGVQHELAVLGSDGSGSFADFSIAGSNTLLTTQGLHLRSFGGGQILNGASLTIDGSHDQGAKLSVDGAVGFQVDGILDVKAGGLSNNKLGFIGLSPGSTGVATVTGAGSQWNNSSSLAVGNSGDGTLKVEEGGFVSNTFGYIGSFPGSTGMVTVAGTNSHWENSDFLAVGLFGNGMLNVESGGLITNKFGYVGYLPSSTGKVTVAGTNSHWNNLNGLLLGGTSSTNGGKGTLRLFGSGRVSVGNDLLPGRPRFVGRDLIPEYSPLLSEAALTVSDTGSNGNLLIRNGSTVSNTGYSIIGLSPGSTGVATVTGSGSQWINDITSFIGLYGNGTLNVEAGGVVNNAFRTFLGIEEGSLGVATVTGSGSELNTSGDMYVGGAPSGNVKGKGRLRVEAAGLVSNTTAHIGSGVGATGEATVTGSGSLWNNSNYLSVGYYGNGTLNVEAGGVVNSTTISYVARHASSTGVATVSGSGSQWNSPGNMHVGYKGDGTLIVSAGGFVSNASGFIGTSYHSTSEAKITGLGSLWDNFGSLKIGETGSGTLIVEEGGKVISIGGYIGDISGSTGEATVSGVGSQWNNSGFLQVGLHGNGMLNVEAGAVVKNTVSYIGNAYDSTGVAKVTGNGSQWINSSSLYVGNNQEGNGTLRIEAGGFVSNTIGFIGRDPFATGLVAVTGGNSVWNNSDSLYIGGRVTRAGGDGELNIKDGGQVSVTNILKTWGPGTLNLDGGSIIAGVLDPAVGTFNWTAGQLNVDNYIGDLTQDAGTLVVGNDSGLTVITGEYSLNNGGTVDIELGGSGGVAGVDYDQLEVMGGASVAGTLNVSLIDGFTPLAGDIFEIIHAGSLLGSFESMNLPLLPDDLLWFVNQTETTLQLLSTYAADFDQDGDVDSIDLNNSTQGWQARFGNGLDGSDFLNWQRQLGNGVNTTGMSQVVPEPNTSMMLMGFIGLFGLYCRSSISWLI